MGKARTVVWARYGAIALLAMASAVAVGACTPAADEASRADTSEATAGPGGTETGGGAESVAAGVVEPSAEVPTASEDRTAEMLAAGAATAAAMAAAGGVAGGDGSVGAVADDALLGTWVATLPAADTSGRTLQLDLAPDGVAQLVSDYGPDDPAIVEIGTWQSYGDGTVTVVLTTRLGGEASGAPTTLLLEMQGDVLAAVEYDQEAFGSEGLSFRMLPPE